jgi:hypothetical protein
MADYLYLLCRGRNAKYFRRPGFSAYSYFAATALALHTWFREKTELFGRVVDDELSEERLVFVDSNSTVLSPFASTCLPPRLATSGAFMSLESSWCELALKPPPPRPLTPKSGM